MTPDFTAFRRLCAIDQQAVCKALKLPVPTPDVPIDIILIQEKLTPGDALTRLERSRDLQAMIAAACLRGKVTKCQPDAQLNPKPHPKGATAANAVPATRRSPVRTSPTRVLATVIPNPKRPGSAARDRYAKYKTGLTEAELLAAGLTRADLTWDTQRGHITWKDK